MKRLFLILSIMACICSCTVGRGTSMSNGKDMLIPADFQLILSLSPGGAGESGTRPWSLTLTGDGKAVQDTTPSWKDKREEHTIKSFSLSKREMEQVYRTTKDGVSFTPPSGGISSCIDCGALILEVTMNGKLYQYMVEDLTDIGLDDEIVRTVARILLKKIPSPNKNKELKMFKIES